MESKKLTPLLLISMFIISTANPILDCGSCKTPPPTPKPTFPVKPPINLPPIVKPPITLPPITLPPVIGKPPITTLPPTVKPPGTGLPPVVPPGILPPGGGIILPAPPGKGEPGTPCPPPPSGGMCPINAVKLGACVDLLGGLVHVGLGDPAANECCPVIAGLVELEAAVCLCSSLKLKLLNLNLYLPIALQLLLTCGKPPPSGYTCSF